ncbi:transcriptional regulator [Vibrio galatheae]|uniref:transcriptional regulator n=1 Tax=Vibrio galatheae TaxID=579748 RepID=UPI000A91B5C6|nr:transcriptional regulator [Vibrio galatheae]
MQYKQKHFSARLPVELRDWLDEESKRRFQSKNAFLIDVIRKAKEEQEKCKV